MRNQVETTVDVSDVVVTNLLTFLGKKGLLGGEGSEWSGTMTDLRNQLVRTAGKVQARNLPQSASALRVVLNRVVNRVRARGVSMKFIRSPDYNRTRLVRFVG